MARITANPSAMREYEKATGDMAQDLCDCVKPLGEALDAFRASEGWSEFLSDVPPLDIDLAAGGGRLRRLGAWVGDVGGAFELIDSESRIVKAEELWIGLLAPRLQDPGRPPALVRDGDRWILNGSDEADHIQVINRDGDYVARVGRLGTDGRLAYDEVPLTDEQAGNLVIRTGAGNDVVEVPPSARLRVTIWTGAGDDMVGAGGTRPTGAMAATSSKSRTAATAAWAGTASTPSTAAEAAIGSRVVGATTTWTVVEVTTCSEG